MMEEVSTMMAYDAQVMEQMSEQEILACLAAETGPTFTVPAKKAKVKESRLQIMDDEEENLLDKCLKENHRLQEASHRLEQENDNLAYRLITSKVALRNALDKTEDRVDELTKDLLQTRHQLHAAEEEKRGKEEEAAMLKDVFRRELEKAEQQIKRSTVIIADYKQICSQLMKRLERQQAAHREELDSLKDAVKACPRCRHAVETDEPSAAGHCSSAQILGTTEQGRCEDNEGPRQAQERKEDREQETVGAQIRDLEQETVGAQIRDLEQETVGAQIRDLEQELAQTKLQMVEAKCKMQELEHQKGVLANNLHETKNSWISKALTSLRTSGGGLHSLSIPKDGAPAVGWNLHSGSLSGWRAKKLSWPYRDKRENV